MYPTDSRRDRRLDWQRLSLFLGGLLVAYYLLPLLALAWIATPQGLLATVTDPAVRGAAATSLVASLTSTVLAGLLGVPLAYWLADRRDRLGQVVLVLVIVPLILPPVVSGILLVSLFGTGGVLGTVGLGLDGSFLGVVFAQTFVASPLVVVTARTAFRGVGEDVREASRVLGCTPWGSFRRVALPIARPGILAGLALAFGRAMGEFGATMLLAYYPRTLPVQIWVSFSSRGIDAAFPVAVVLVVVSLGVLVLVTLLGVSPRSRA